MWKCLDTLGYGGKTLRVIQRLYDNLTATATLNELQSDIINLKMGLKQVCVLSPLLFALYIKEIGDKLVASGLGVEIGGTRIPAMFFCG